jgi:hypothetical protein
MQFTVRIKNALAVNCRLSTMNFLRGGRGRSRTSSYPRHTRRARAEDGDDGSGKTCRPKGRGYIFSLSRGLHSPLSLSAYQSLGIVAAELP